MLTRLIILVVLVFAPLFGAAADDSRSILMITWRGITAAEEGFVEKLRELGVVANFEYFDAGRDQTNLAGFLRENLDKLRSKDLIYVFGTTANLTVQNFNVETVPRVFNIVADPVAVGLVSSLELPPQDITGAKLSLPPEVSLQLLKMIHPVKSLAILFDPRESNAVAEVESLARAAEKLKIDATQLRFAPDGDEQSRQLSSLIPQLENVDAVYVAPSSSFVANSGILRQIIPDDVLSFGPSSAYIDEGITLVFGTEYRERGEAAAELAAKILLENVPAHELPINQIDASNAVLFINKDSKAASRLKLDNLSNAIVYR